jgi:hypothetical protein
MTASRRSGVPARRSRRPSRPSAAATSNLWPSPTAWRCSTALKLEGEGDQGRHRARARHQPDVRGQGDRAVRSPHGIDARRGRCAGRLERRYFRCLRLRLFRRRLRHGSPRHAAHEPEGAWSRATSQDKIVIQDPRTSTPGLGLLLWVKAVYGDEAVEAWAKLQKRVLTVTPGWSEAYGLFTKRRGADGAVLHDLAGLPR